MVVPYAIARKDVWITKFGLPDVHLRRATVRCQEFATTDFVSEYWAPNANAFFERFIESIQQECLDRFVVFGSGHIDQICAEYLEHYHTERPHQGIENELVVGAKSRSGPLEETISLSEVRSSGRLGGVLRSYWRKAG